MKSNGMHSLRCRLAQYALFSLLGITPSVGWAAELLPSLIIQVGDQTATYGQGLPEFSVSYTGFLNGDTTNLLGGLLRFSFQDSNHASLATLDVNTTVGTYFVVPAGLTSTNYTITFMSGTLTVVPAPLTVQANNAIRGINTKNPRFSGSIFGLQNADNVTATYACLATNTSPAGTYPIIPALLDPQHRLGNYTVTMVNGVLTIADVAAVVIRDANGAPGALVRVPIDLVTHGTENTVGFSLAFDPLRLSYVSNTIGSAMAPGSGLFVNTNPAFAGALGVLLGLPAGRSFPMGTRQLAIFTFQVSPEISTSLTTPITFADHPAFREVASVTAETLPASFTPGEVRVFVGHEADMVPLPNGDARVTATDWVLMDRFVAGLSTPGNPGQFMRVDCAPRATKGDGRISVIDRIQAGRFALALDPLELLDGPDQAIKTARTEPPSANRLVRIRGVRGNAGDSLQIPVEMITAGDENAVGFSLMFDPASLRLLNAAAGPGLTPDAQLILNTNDAPAGRLGVIMALPLGRTWSAGTNQAMLLTMEILNSTPIGCPDLIFTDSPVVREFGSVDAAALPGQFQLGTVVVADRPNILQLAPSPVDARKLRLTMSGTPGRAYSMLVATNFRDWTFWTNSTANSIGLVEIIDPIQTKNKIWHYRAMTQ